MQQNLSHLECTCGKMNGLEIELFCIKSPITYNVKTSYEVQGFQCRLPRLNYAEKQGLVIKLSRKFPLFLFASIIQF